MTVKIYSICHKIISWTIYGLMKGEEGCFHKWFLRVFGFRKSHGSLQFKISYMKMGVWNPKNPPSPSRNSFWMTPHVHKIFTQSKLDFPYNWKHFFPSAALKTHNYNISINFMKLNNHISYQQVVEKFFFIIKIFNQPIYFISVCACYL